MANYTKGEWQTYLTDTLPDRWTICAGEKGERGIAKTVLDNVIPPQEKEANARLIAAAPSMYEALKEMRRLYNEESILSIQGAEKALAKAEGGE